MTYPHQCRSQTSWHNELQQWANEHDTTLWRQHRLMIGTLMLRDKWKEVFLYFKHALHKYYVVLKHAACALFLTGKEMLIWQMCKYGCEVQHRPRERGTCGCFFKNVFSRTAAWRTLPLKCVPLCCLGGNTESNRFLDFFSPPPKSNHDWWILNWWQIFRPRHLLEWCGSLKNEKWAEEASEGETARWRRLKERERGREASEDTVVDLWLLV